MTKPATNRRVIVVLGTYRSGTSLTARILNRLGVGFGPASELVPANRHNPGGYFERTDLNDANTRLISSAGGSLAMPPSPERIAANADETALQAVNLDWTPRARRWGLKDPRLCHTLLAWVESQRLPLEELTLINVVRDTPSVLRSAGAHESVMGYAGHDSNRLAVMIRRGREDADWHLRTLPVPAMTVRYENLVENPMATTQQLAAFIGVTSSWRIWWASRTIGKERQRDWARARGAAVALRDRLTMRLGRWRHAWRNNA